ncbi:MAG: phenylalanyl-tRNA synthetase alpha chain, partial [Actinomycetota bacterium]
MIDEITAARDEAVRRIHEVSDLAEAEALESELLGRKGPFAGFKAGLGGLGTPDEKRGAGQALHEATAAVEEALGERLRRLRSAARAEQLVAERIDLTETMHSPRRGHAHVVTQAWQRLEDVFVGMGFQVAEGPEVETDWHNFEALNMPPQHPARSMHDTFYVDHGAPGSTVLRTHTSPVQIRVMQTLAPPIYMVMPG